MTTQESDVSLLSHLFNERFQAVPDEIKPLAAAGSNRRYYLLSIDEGRRQVVGTVGDDTNENQAFIYLAGHFASKGINVPEVLIHTADFKGYLQTYIPGHSLFDDITSGTADSSRLISKVMKLLVQFQYIGSKGCDFTRCYPVPAMDGNMVDWDLNYFKYCFLKASGVEFNELSLQNEFNRLGAVLLEDIDNCKSFMYRDFQSRNIMVRETDGEYFGIDFQGGRRGPAMYDVASFLWQAKALFTRKQRDFGVETYCQSAAAVFPGFDRDAFIRRYPYFILFRILQTLGAYGFRGLVEHKSHFINSLPFGIRNLKEFFNLYYPDTADEFPTLSRLAAELHEPPPAVTDDGKLTVTVQSFSYRKGYPLDNSGNGGGFIFDCRAIHNPGRYDRYKPLTGLDKPVKDFLEENGEIYPFLENAFSLVDSAVEKYIKRGFTSLNVGFGCTGGRHRSVYSAHAMAEHLKEKFPKIIIIERHREQSK